MHPPSTRFTSELFEVAETPGDLPPRIAQHESDVEGLRGDVQNWNTRTDHTRLARALTRLANVLRLAGRLDEAEATLDEATDCFGRINRPYAAHLNGVRMASIWYAMERYGDADHVLTALEEQVHPGHQDLLYLWRGLARAKLGDTEAALADLTAARAIRAGRPRERGVDEIDDLIEVVESEG